MWCWVVVLCFVCVTRFCVVYVFVVNMCLLCLGVLCVVVVLLFASGLKVLFCVCAYEHACVFCACFVWCRVVDVWSGFKFHVLF